MPVIEKFLVKSECTAHIDTALHIFSYIFYPENDEKRNAYISYWAGYERDTMRTANREQVINDLTAWYGEGKAQSIELTTDEYFVDCKKSIMERASRHPDAFG